MNRNVLANFMGTGWVAFLSLVLLPIYIRFIGIEAYGLVGFYTSLQSIFLLLDFGLSASMTRELAFLAAQEKKGGEMRTLLRSTETIYWIVALGLGLGLVAGTPLISRNWLRLEHVPIATANRAIALMGVSTFFRWPITLYTGSLLGLQRQVMVNVVRGSIETLRAGGAVLMLGCLSPTVEAFFIWQALVTALHALVIRTLVWRAMPVSQVKDAFDRGALKTIWRFAAGMTGISITAVCLTQLDKIVLSKLLTLKEFGYYSMASTFAMGFAQIGTPITTAAYPRFVELIALKDTSKLTEVYHKSCQLIAVVAIPTAAVICLNSKSVLFLWTRDPEVVAHAAQVLRLLMIGTCLNVLVALPFSLQVAHKWTRLALVGNVIAAVLLSPLTIVLARRWGPVGAASVWIALNVSYVFITVPIMHRRLLPNEMRAWYVNDLGKPLLGGGVMAAALYVLRTDSLGAFSRPLALAWLSVAVCLAVASALLCTPSARAGVLAVILGRRRSAR